MSSDPNPRRADTGLEESNDFLGEAVRRFVPQPLARAALTVDLTTDYDRYVQGTSVDCRVEFRNRLPVPVGVRTAGLLLWDWEVDGRTPTHDEPRVFPDSQGVFEFKGGERKVVEFSWDGRLKDGDTWSLAPVGSYELTVFVATGNRRPSARATIEIVDREA
ncbi:hypothetical protein [Halogeometricum sp. CBA1124]|uniref:hypothetical protein n=1 Tax=Halogeometricum sp. CBA1124 TaxID=2668071 RepID=UPI001429E427|nr:hypothetical protein [Halogeometricum sp. CBA1124]MUV56204.1 hypothetical protein [Halogeometricum sp. CBA1124]